MSGSKEQRRPAAAELAESIAALQRETAAGESRRAGETAEEQRQRAEELAESIAELAALFLVTYQRQQKRRQLWYRRAAESGETAEELPAELLADLWILLYQQRSPKSEKIIQIGRDLEELWRILAESPLYTRSFERMQGRAERETAEYLAAGERIYWQQEYKERAERAEELAELADNEQERAAETAEYLAAELLVAEKRAKRIAAEAAAELLAAETAEELAESRRETAVSLVEKSIAADFAAETAAAAYLAAAERAEELAA